jgi:hypothetical protein
MYLYLFSFVIFNTAGDVPAKLGDVPVKLGDVPAKLGDIPAKLGDIPGDSGKVVLYFVVCKIITVANSAFQINCEVIRI